MNEKVAAPVETLPDSWEVSAAVWASRAAPNWNASPPLVPCRMAFFHLPSAAVAMHTGEAAIVSLHGSLCVVVFLLSQCLQMGVFHRLP